METYVSIFYIFLDLFVSIVIVFMDMGSYLCQKEIAKRTERKENYKKN